MNEKQENTKDTNIDNINWEALEEYWASEYTKDYAPKK